MAAFVPDTRVSVMFLYRRWGLNEIISSSLRSSLICQEVDDLAPRKSREREEEAEMGEKVKLSWEFSANRARYILKAMSLLTLTKFFVPSSRPLLVTVKPRLPGGARGRPVLLAAREAKWSAEWWGCPCPWSSWSP